MDGNKVANNWHKLKFLTKVNSLNVKLVENEKGGGCMFLLSCVQACIVELQTKTWNGYLIAAKRIGIGGCCDTYNCGSNKKIPRHGHRENERNADSTHWQGKKYTWKNMAEYVLIRCVRIWHCSYCITVFPVIFLMCEPDQLNQITGNSISYWDSTRIARFASGKAASRAWAVIFWRCFIYIIRQNYEDTRKRETRKRKRWSSLPFAHFPRMHTHVISPNKNAHPGHMGLLSFMCNFFPFLHKR